MDFNPDTGEIADHIDAQIAAGGQSAQQSANSGAGGYPDDGLGSLASAKAGQLSHLSSPTYKLIAIVLPPQSALRAEDLGNVLVRGLSLNALFGSRKLPGCS